MIREEIIFFGTSDIAVPCLAALINNNFNVVAVITQPDKPQGRKRSLIPSPIKLEALKHDIPIIQPDKLKISHISDIKAELGVLVSYGQILSQEILDYFFSGILNMHPSLLPKYRGPSPIQSTLLNGDEFTGVSIIRLNKNMDAGPIVAQKEVFIDTEDDYISLTKKLSEVGAKLMVQSIDPYLQKKIKLIKQNNDKSVYCKLVNKNDGEIYFNDSPKKIINKLKAYASWPGIYFIHKNKRFKIKKAHLGESQELVIESIQPEGKKEMSWDDFSRGYKEITSLFS